jgi:hypothetical protein
MQKPLPRCANPHTRQESLQRALGLVTAITAVCARRHCFSLLVSLMSRRRYWLAKYSAAKTEQLPGLPIPASTRPFQMASRQLLWRRKHKILGLCAQCSQPRYLGTTYCKVHLTKQKLSKRKSQGFKAWKPGGKGRPPANTIRLFVKADLSSLPVKDQACHLKGSGSKPFTKSILNSGTSGSGTFGSASNS